MSYRHTTNNGPHHKYLHDVKQADAKLLVAHHLHELGFPLRAEMARDGSYTALHCVWVPFLSRVATTLQRQDILDELELTGLIYPKPIAAIARAHSPQLNLSLHGGTL